MRLIIRDDPTAVGDYIANYLCKRINDFSPTASKPFVLGLPTGSSPIPTYKALIKFVKEGKLSFKHVVTFNMDEYVGLPRDHSQSYHTFMFREFFSHIDIPPSQVNILDGNAVDLVAECNSYEQRIKSFGGIELFLGGIGEDGHIAFNEPGRGSCLPLSLSVDKVQGPRSPPGRASRPSHTTPSSRTHASLTMISLLSLVWRLPLALRLCWTAERLSLLLLA